MGKIWLVCVSGLTVVLLVAVGALNVEEELESFMKDTLDAAEKDLKSAAQKKGSSSSQPEYHIKHSAQNSSADVKFEEARSNVTGDGNSSSKAAKSVPAGDPAFGEGVGSGFYGRLPRGPDGHGYNGRHVIQGQRIVGGPSRRNFNGGYQGFGSPEIDDGRSGGQPQGHQFGDLQQGKYQQGDVGPQYGGLRVPPVVPDGRMGLPRPDGCLCTGPVLNPCCFQDGVVIKGDNQQYQPSGHHHPHPHPDTQKLPRPENIVQKPQTPIGLEYRGEFTCPVTNGNFPHPTDCSRFLQCSHGVPYDNPCPENLLYDATTGMCNWPDLVHCDRPRGTVISDQVYNSTLLIPASWQIPWEKCRSMEVAVNAVLISVSQAILGKPCPNKDCQFPYIIVNCLK